MSVARIWVWCVVFEQTLDRCLGLFADSYKTPEYSAWLGIPLLAILGDLSAQASSPIFERIFNHFIHCRLNFAFHIPFPHPIVYVMLRPKECDNYKPCPHWSTRNKIFEPFGIFATTKGFQSDMGPHLDWFLMHFYTLIAHLIRGTHKKTTEGLNTMHLEEFSEIVHKIVRIL